MSFSAKKIRSVLLIFAGGGTLALLASLTPVNAQSVGSISMEPIKREGEIRHVFQHVAAEGTEIEDGVVVKNGKKTSTTILLFSSAFNFENNELHPVEKDPNPAGDPAFWTTFEQHELVLPPGGEQEVKFKIKVPDNADVGEHTGAIMIAEKAPAVKARGTGLSVVVLTGAQLVVNVPGDVKRDLDINKITHFIRYTEKGRTLEFNLNAINNGNVTIRPNVFTEIRGLFGKVGEHDTKDVNPIERATKGDMKIAWPKRAPYFGRFVADFDIHLGEATQYNDDGTKTTIPDEVVEARYVFWIVPLVEIIYFLLGILAMYLLRSLWLYLIVVRRLRIKSQKYIVKDGDTLTSIGHDFEIDPKLISKFNLLSWPYELLPGDQLLIPIGKYGHGETLKRSLKLWGNKELWSDVFLHLFRRKRLKSVETAARAETYHEIIQAPKVRRTFGNVQINSKEEAVESMDKEYGADSVAAVPASSLTQDTVVVEAGDTIVDVAEFADTNWEVIAELNHLQPPYILSEGQELRIPVDTGEAPVGESSVGVAVEVKPKKRVSKPAAKSTSKSGSKTVKPVRKNSAKKSAPKRTTNKKSASRKKKNEG